MSEIYKVHFVSHNKTVKVSADENLLDAAYRAKVPINAVCGGFGSCGKCEVVLKDGNVSSYEKPTNGNVYLACKTKPVSDVIIEVLAEKEVCVNSDELNHFNIDITKSFEKNKSLVRKIYLELNQPTDDDNLADKERICNALAQRFDLPITIKSKVLQSVSNVLRKSDWKITATIAFRENNYEVIGIEQGDKTNSLYGIAIDIGTTTITALLLNMATAEIIGSDSCYNSQINFGADVISRILHSEKTGGLKELQESIGNDIQTSIVNLCRKFKLETSEINLVICSGNTTMIHFLLGLEATNIRRAPFIPTALYTEPIECSEINFEICSNAVLYTLPAIGSYIGSDITAGVYATSLHKSEELKLLVDVGTNGEIVIGNNEWMICCSASVGPAFEGAGLQHGLRATNGAISTFDISKKGEFCPGVIGESKPIGICGTGIIDIIASLLKEGYIDRSGKFLDKCNDKIIIDEYELPELVIVDKIETDNVKQITVSKSDIENVIRAKGAVYAAIESLLESLDMDVNAINSLIVAGDFGNYLNKRNAFTIGLLPEMPEDKIENFGNSSLAGAAMAAMSIEVFNEIKNIASKMTVIDLMNYPPYMDKLIAANFLPHTNIEKFPSTAKLLNN